MVQGADGCTMVTGASDSIGPMTPQPLRFMCSGAVLPLQCFPLGVPTARHPPDLCPALLYNAVVPCWRTFAQRTHGHVGSALGATRMSCGRGVAAQSGPQNSSDAGCRQVTILYTMLANWVCNKPEDIKSLLIPSRRATGLFCFYYRIIFFLGSLRLMT